MLGSGALESIYEKCLVHELGLWGIACLKQQAVTVRDQDGVKGLLARATFDVDRLRIIRADAACAGRLERWVRRSCHW